MTTKPVYMYHREAAALPWTTTDEGEENYPRLMGYAESLEDLRVEVTQNFATGFVASYPTSGELVVLDGRHDTAEVVVCAVWPLDELRRLRMEPGISPLRSWMAEVAPRIGKSQRRGGLGEGEAARAFLELWGRVQEQAPVLAEQERAWLRGAVRTSPSLHAALVGLVARPLLEDYEEVKAMAALRRSSGSALMRGPPHSFVSSCAWWSNSKHWAANYKALWS